MKKNIPIIIVAILLSGVIWVSVSLSNEYYTTMQIPLKVINFPQGFTSGTYLPKDLSIKLKGEGWKILAFDLTRDEEYIVSAGGDSGRRFINVFNYLPENQWLSSDFEVINISPDTISFVIEKIIEKKVKVLPKFDLDYRSGYGLASTVKVIPESIQVYGPRSQLRDIEYITTELFSSENLDQKLNERVALAPVPGFDYNPSSVSIILDVQQIVDKAVHNLPVQITDIPKDRDVTLIPGKIEVGVRGGIDILGKLNTGQIKASINYRDVVLDTLGSIKPRVDLPQDISIIYIKPERLRYIIKKFN